MPPSKSQNEWYQEPYLHILPVFCADKSTYDSQVKDQITQWLGDKVFFYCRIIPKYVIVFSEC